MFGRRLARIGQLFGPPQTQWNLALRLPFDVSNKSLEPWDSMLHFYCRRKTTWLRDQATALTGIMGAFGSAGA